ncbi:MAG: polysaccharide deacetylase family protein [Vicinamibacterales bacterium]
MRLVIYSSIAPDMLQHLLWRLEIDLPEVSVAGVLYETGRPALPTATRATRFLRLLRDPDFVRYVGHRAARAVAAAACGTLDRALRVVHAAPRDPNGPALTLAALADAWRARGVEFHVTRDLHDTASLDCMRRLAPDLGLIYGTRILRPELFTIPARGSINIHKHKVPEYRGSGAPGLWELRDGRTEQTVTVHRVVREVDAGAILGERTFPIEPLDTLESVQLKADVIGVDLLVDVLRDEALGRSVERPQPAGGTVYKGYQPHRKFAIERRIRASRRQWRPVYTRSLPKRLARAVLLPLVALRNHRRRRAGRCPVIVLYHHLTCDREKRMALPTAALARQVRYLKRHYRIVSLPEAVALLRRDEVSEPTVVLTFDDGYAENFTGLRAIAEIQRVPVTICVCTQHVTDRSELDHDVARGERGFPSMGWEEVRYLDRHGVTIASHTRTHFNCGTTDDAALVREIGDSRRELQEQLGHPVEFFAFPKGKPQHITPLACGIALRLYPVVMSAAGGPNLGPSRLPMELRRYSHPDSIVELEMQLQEILDPQVPPRPRLLGVLPDDGGETEKRRADEHEHRGLRQDRIERACPRDRAARLSNSHRHRLVEPGGGGLGRGSPPHRQ